MNDRIINELRSFIGEDNLIIRPRQLCTYECYGLTYLRIILAAVTFNISQGCFLGRQVFTFASRFAKSTWITRGSRQIINITPESVPQCE